MPTWMWPRQESLSLALMQNRSQSAEWVISNFRRAQSPPPGWVWLQLGGAWATWEGGQEGLLKELVGLFLGFGAKPSVALLAILPRFTCYSFTGRKFWSCRPSRREGERGAGQEFSLLGKLRRRDRDLLPFCQI